MNEIKYKLLTVMKEKVKKKHWIKLNFLFDLIWCFFFTFLKWKKNKEENKEKEKKKRSIKNQEQKEMWKKELKWWKKTEKLRNIEREKEENE